MEVLDSSETLLTIYQNTRRRVLYPSTLKMEAPGYSETLVTIYQNTSYPVPLYPEYGRTMLLRNVGNSPPDYTASHLSRQ
jgi:hypothetical protein